MEISKLNSDYIAICSHYNIDMVHRIIDIDRTMENWGKMTNRQKLEELQYNAERKMIGFRERGQVIEYNRVILYNDFLNDSIGTLMSIEDKKNSQKMLEKGFSQNFISFLESCMISCIMDKAMLDCGIKYLEVYRGGKI